jgi:hypothetical protein
MSEKMNSASRKKTMRTDSGAWLAKQFVICEAQCVGREKSELCAVRRVSRVLRLFDADIVRERWLEQ